MMGKKLLGRFLNEERGQVLILTALLILVILGITAFTTDIGWLQSEKRHLQNTADAAALAGARDLANGNPSSVVATVNEYVEANGVDINEVKAIDIVDGKRVKVALEGSRGLFFARVLGFSSSRVGARATAEAGPPGTMKGVLPIGISMKQYNELPQAGYTPITKETFTDDASGNWGWVDLDYIISNSTAADQANYIVNGFIREVYIGQEIKGDNGAKIESAGNLKKDVPITGTPDPNDMITLMQKLEDYFTNHDILYVPVLEEDWSTSKTMHIKGFTAITLTGVGGKNANDFWISAEIDKTASIFTGGVLDPDAPDFGLKAIGLVE